MSALAVVPADVPQYPMDTERDFALAARDLREIKFFECHARSDAKKVKERRAELCKRAAKTIQTYQEKYGDSRDALIKLAKAAGVGIASLYRWKRIGDGKPARKISDASDALRATYYVIRRKSPCSIGQFVSGDDYVFCGFTDEVIRAARIYKEDLEEGQTLEEMLPHAQKQLHRKRYTEFKVELSDLELVKVTASYRLVVTP
jgi:hypothetical protein